MLSPDIRSAGHQFGHGDPQQFGHPRLVAALRRGPSGLLPLLYGPTAHPDGLRELLFAYSQPPASFPDESMNAHDLERMVIG